MINWLGVFKHVLPNARAWRITVDKQLRAFFGGLTGVGEDAKTFLDLVFEDIDPQKTRVLSDWERQFGLMNSGLSDQERRDRLDAAWKAEGGQDPTYIQNALRAAGFDVYVHEWWEPVPGRPEGGSVNGDVVPVARNPFSYLWDGAAPRQFIGSGHNLAYAGGDLAFSNSQSDPPGYPLVNKVLESTTEEVGAGHVDFYAGGIAAVAGATLTTYSQKQYVMPADPATYPYYLYIAGENFPDIATVEGARRNEFEDLCLKICPTEQWIGVIVNYS